MPPQAIRKPHERGARSTAAANAAVKSSTPLPQKLGIKEGHKLALIGAPTGFVETLGALPMGVTLHPLATRARHPPLLDVLVAFVTTRAQLSARLAACRARMQPAAGLWFAWPKKTSGVPTELTEQTLRDVILPTGLVDNKVCAIDATWSGLRFVIRKELRGRGARLA